MNPTAKTGLQKALFIAVIALCCSLLAYFFLPNTISEASRRVSAVFIFAVFFWAFEVVPLYATSLIVVVLLMFLLTKPGEVLELGEAGYTLFLSSFSSPVIMLFLGGFILAAAVHKHKVDLFIMQRVLGKFGTGAYRLTAGSLFLSAFFSMWISNTAAAAMMLALTKPILRHLDRDDPLQKAIVLAVAFGSNIGGIGTPIGTPPNALAIGILAEQGIRLNFLGWMLMGVPLALILLIIAAVVLFLFFPPKRKEVPYEISTLISLTPHAIGVLVIGLLMIFAWLTKPIHHIPEALIALLGVALFAGFRLISTADLKGIDWNILILMWGGLALGEALKVSGVIDTLMDTPLFAGYGSGLIILLSCLALLLSSFISNTATANLLLPIAVSIGTIDKSMLSITVALACSFALTFPISTPPNALAYSTGVFTTKEMFLSGGLISVLSLAVMFLGFEFVIPWALKIHVI